MIKSKDIKIVPIELVIPNEKNRNNHSEEQLKVLEKIVKSQGFRDPIVVSNRSGKIVSGHARLIVAQRLKYKEVPVSYQDFDSDAQEYKHLIAANEIARYAEFDKLNFLEDIKGIGDVKDIDFEEFGLIDFEIPKIERIDSEGEDEFVFVPKIVKTVLGDIYELGQHRLMCGDSTMIDQVERLMSGSEMDMAYIDPPYGINIVSKKGTIGGNRNGVKAGVYPRIINDDSIDTAGDSYNLCLALKIKAMIFWGANHYCQVLPGSPCWIIWDKNNSGDFADAELAWTNQKTAARIFKHTWNGMIKESEKKDKRIHPTQKPVALAEWCFEKYGKDSKNVLDLFMGSGSTLIACEKTERKCFGMEMSPEYCDSIVSRYVKYTGNNRIKLNGVEIDWI